MNQYFNNPNKEFETTSDGDPEPEPTLAAINQAEALIYQTGLERLVMVRDINRRLWESAAVRARKEALAVEDQLRQATDAYYFEGGRK